MMNRRQFLKALGIIGVSGFMSRHIEIAADAYPGFDPNQMYGSYLTVTERFDPKDPNNDPIIRGALRILDDQIENIIPPQYRKMIRYEYIEPKFIQDNFWEVHNVSVGVISWKYYPYFNWKTYPPKVVILNDQWVCRIVNNCKHITYT